MAIELPRILAQSSKMCRQLLTKGLYIAKTLFDEDIFSNKEFKDLPYKTYQLSLYVANLDLEIKSENEYINLLAVKQ